MSDAGLDIKVYDYMAWEKETGHSFLRFDPQVRKVNEKDQRHAG